MYSEHIGNVKEEGGFYPHAGVLFSVEPDDNETDDNNRAHIEIMQTPYIFTYGQCFFLYKCLI